MFVVPFYLVTIARWLWLTLNVPLPVVNLLGAIAYFHNRGLANDRAIILAAVVVCSLALCGLLIASATVTQRAVCALSLLLTLLVPLMYQYQPALVAAPGHTQAIATQVNLLGGLVKQVQVIAEKRPCQYDLVGWSADNALYFTEECGNGSPRTYAYSPDALQPASPVTTEEVIILEAAMQAPTDLVRATRIRPELESQRRRTCLKQGGLPSIDGRWVALVAQHPYGPEDVLVVSR